MNRELNLSLASSVASGRMLAAVREMESDGQMVEFAVAGASNADRSVAALARKGVTHESWQVWMEFVCRERCG